MKTRSLFPLTLLSLAAALMTGCGGLNSPSAPQFTKMVFLSNRTVSPATNLFIQTLAGTIVTPVPTTTAEVYYVSVSADATKAAFDQSGDAWVENVDGSSALQLTTTGRIDFVRIAPNGKKVVFNDDTLGHLFIINIDGTGTLDLTPTLPANMTSCYSAGFSADSTQIAFVCEGDTDYGIYTVKADGTGMTTVTATRTVWTDLPSFSPDNTKIFFIGQGSGETYDVESISLTGAGDVVVVANTYEAEVINSNIYYTFAPTGLEVNQIYKAGLDGSNPVSLSDGVHNDYLGLAQ